MMHVNTTTANNGNPYVPLNRQVSLDTMRRVQGLKALCICELLFAIWGTVSISLFYVILIPIDIIGLLAAGRLNTTMLNIFSLLKALCLGFVGLVTADFIYNSQYSEHPVADAGLIIALLVAELFMQALCMFIAVRIRRDILLAQASAAASVELSSISDSHIPLPQTPMQVPPQHFQDPHATVGVAGYPYPPPQQFYPAMYMNQGYPTPYAHYPTMHPSGGMPSPVATYPTFTISEDQQSTNETKQ